MQLMLSAVEHIEQKQSQLPHSTQTTTVSINGAPKSSACTNKTFPKAQIVRKWYKNRNFVTNRSLALRLDIGNVHKLPLNTVKTTARFAESIATTGSIFVAPNTNNNNNNNIQNNSQANNNHNYNTNTTSTSNNNTNNSHSGSARKMEHSYMRDHARPTVVSTGLAPARTILCRHPPQCGSCFTHPLDEDELEDVNKVPVPAYNEIVAKEAMNECAHIAKYVKNTNSDDEDWVERVQQYSWTSLQKSLFAKVVRILNNDYLARLATVGRQHEAVQRRVQVDLATKRMRLALAEVAWEVRLTQWLHCLLMESLPATYMASYLEILQTLRSKVPQLMDKMLFGRPLNFSQELLAPVMKKRWEPPICPKMRKVTQNAVIIVIPPNFGSDKLSRRLQKWYQQLGTYAELIPIALPTTSGHHMRQPLEQIAEQVVSLTRVKIQELRNENPTRSIVLVGFNAGAAMALQVAMSVSVSCMVCLGLAYNTLNGVRGAPDDRLLDIKTPILFVIGQNSARTSPEEIESLREKMQSETSFVVVGSADDVLRVPKSRRGIENVTQAMVDTMIHVEEVL